MSVCLWYMAIYFFFVSNEITFAVGKITTTFSKLFQSFNY